MQYINEIRPDVGFMVYGAALDLWQDKSSECIIAGPAETGKTIAALHKLHLMAQNHKGAHLAMVRKTQKSMYASVIKSFEDKVLEPGSPVTRYGGSKPDWYDYPNGSRIIVAGMDNPTKMLSAEYDAIYVNQAEELTLDEWETLTTRATGRAGNMPYAQTFGDCNPGPPKHWIKHRASLSLYHSRHEDNPVLYDQATGEITEQGRRTMAVLDNLTGNRKERLRYGRWVQSDGVIYPQFDERIHIVDRFAIPDDWQRIRVIDFGFVHPFVCGWWAVDGDGRAYLYREIYMTGRTVTDYAKQINELSKDEYITQTICDHDAGDRQTLAENGISNIAAKKDVLWGIDKVQDRLKVQGDGKARLFFMRDSLVELDQSQRDQHRPVQTTDEFGGYIWANTAKEQPVKKDDDGLDMTRYLVAYLDDYIPEPISEMVGIDLGIYKSRVKRLGGR